MGDEKQTVVNYNNLGPITGLEGPKDLRMENYREYVNQAANNAVYRVDTPVAFYHNAHSHRVIDSNGVVHYIRFGAGIPVVLRWKNVDAENNPVSY